MNLLDLVEMLADWKAAAERGGNDIKDTLHSSIKRFGMGDVMEDVFRNTLDWMERAEG